MSHHLEDNLGDILQKARSGKGFSLSELESQTGIPEKKLQCFEEETEIPKRDQLEALAHCLSLHKERLRDILSEKWAPKPFPKEALREIIILKGYLGAYEVKGYMLMDPEQKEALLIDTAYNPDLVLNTLSEKKLSLKGVLLTHAHQDHIRGLSKICAQTGAPVYLHPKELPLYRHHELKTPDHWVSEGFTISISQKTLTVLETPGHTPGGVSYFSGDYCFVGDALFAGSTGRSFSPEGYTSLLGSLRKKVLSLPDQTLLCPGHGPTTTVGEEHQHNPFFI